MVALASRDDRAHDRRTHRASGAAGAWDELRQVRGATGRIRGANKAQLSPTENNSTRVRASESHRVRLDRSGWGWAVGCFNSVSPITLPVKRRKRFAGAWPRGALRGAAFAPSAPRRKEIWLSAVVWEPATTRFRAGWSQVRDDPSASGTGRAVLEVRVSSGASVGVREPDDRYSSAAGVLWSPARVTARPRSRASARYKRSVPSPVGGRCRAAARAAARAASSE